MSANQLALTNVVNISVAQAGAGVGAYNTSNLALFTNEIPGVSFGSLGYALYLSPTQVGVDFGTSSKAYAMANAIFSQQPNLLAGGGYLAIVLVGVATERLSLSGVPASGQFKINYGAGITAFINWNDTAAIIQTALRAVTGLEEVIVTGSLASQQLNIQMAGVYGAAPTAFTVSNNTLATVAPVSITFTITTPTAGETLGAAITRTTGLIQYFGIIPDCTVAQIGSTDVLAAAAIVLPLNKIAFFVSYTEADIQAGGMLDLLRTGSFTNSRALYYGGVLATARTMAAAYAGRALSVNFSGSNTTQTMHLKDLAGIQPDPTMTQTILGEAQAAGADVYASFQGVSKTFCSGANSFFDQVYNLQWIVGALQVAGFNFLAQSSTKIPQTEAGINGLKNAYRQVCQQALTNQYIAPNVWTSAVTFGNQPDFLLNIQQVGYYIYSNPVSQQSQADRVARVAPLIQIALKEAGAVHSSQVIINVNA